MSTNERDRLKLINELMPYWKSNGWNPKTLQAKTVNQLLGIKRTASKPQKPIAQRKDGQLRFVL